MNSMQHTSALSLKFLEKWCLDRMQAGRNLGHGESTNLHLRRSSSLCKAPSNKARQKIIKDDFWPLPLWLLWKSRSIDKIKLLVKAHEKIANLKWVEFEASEKASAGKIEDKQIGRKGSVSPCSVMVRTISLDKIPIAVALNLGVLGVVSAAFWHLSSFFQYSTHTNLWGRNLVFENRFGPKLSNRKFRCNPDEMQCHLSRYASSPYSPSKIIGQFSERCSARSSQLRPSQKCAN